jgi:hypothetical protein
MLDPRMDAQENQQEQNFWNHKNSVISNFIRLSRRTFSPSPGSRRISLNISLKLSFVCLQLN